MLLFSLFVPLAGYAADDLGTNSGGDDLGTNATSQMLVNPLKGIDSLPKLLEVVLKAVVQLGAIVLTLAIIYVGFLFVAARGNPEKLKVARTALVWTLIGGLILLGAQAISTAIQSTVETLR